MKKSKKFAGMTPAELSKATRVFDAEFVPTRPLTAADRKKHRQARRGRPVVGAGAKRVLVSLESGLLDRADAFARAHGLKRSEMVAESLRRMMVVTK